MIYQNFLTHLDYTLEEYQALVQPCTLSPLQKELMSLTQPFRGFIYIFKLMNGGIIFSANVILVFQSNIGQIFSAPNSYNFQLRATVKSRQKLSSPTSNFVFELLPILATQPCKILHRSPSRIIYCCSATVWTWLVTYQHHR